MIKKEIEGATTRIVTLVCQALLPMDTKMIPVPRITFLKPMHRAPKLQELKNPVSFLTIAMIVNKKED